MHLQKKLYFAKAFGGKQSSFFEHTKDTMHHHDDRTGIDKEQSVVDMTYN